ncbi:TetR/AcrR family transcriptional regulator C-terminal domain-containing protein [Saccharothrix coeruleofusca]|uniref:TetR family transcriptional regulator n=1 Tax=Saccharothrix coeruleofusca TaxID=33919 RepID=A0A918AL44_9PSEU|nr:TetR/AcrR family transcriptional regulator C-terminal domain-containing protein [Saccharothrix coeruleofusca]GGP53128.1 TetR family transcriptional regulator [Saccharothrix coeruleofusca]
MVLYAGQGDAQRSMSLLWRGPDPASGSASDRRPSRPGPKQGLSVDAIVEAAVAVADEQGMAALSMRAVGQRLGRTAMALYTYVPSKAELIDLMYDKVLGELPAEHDLSRGWRAALTAWARETRAFYLRHPWVLQVSQARPVLGPNEFATLEALARVLHGTGLPAPVLRGVIGAVAQFVRGAAQVVADARQAARATGVGDEEWWFSRSPLLERHAPDLARRFPLVVWINQDDPPAVPDADDAPYLERDAMHNFTVGWEVLLDGIEASIAKHGGDQR